MANEIHAVTQTMCMEQSRHEHHQGAVSEAIPGQTRSNVSYNVHMWLQVLGRVAETRCRSHIKSSFIIHICCLGFVKEQQCSSELEK